MDTTGAHGPQTVGATYNVPAGVSLHACVVVYALLPWSSDDVTGTWLIQHAYVQSSFPDYDHIRQFLKAFKAWIILGKYPKCYCLKITTDA